MSKKTILITGANGQLGSEIRATANNHQQFGFIFSDIDTLDITNFDALNHFFTQNKIDYIVNCAAYTNVDKAEKDVANAEKINIDAVENISNIAKKFDTHIIHISTDYVFDAVNKNTPFVENDTAHAISVYGSTKLKGEKLLENYKKALIIRTSWLYSSFGNNFVKTMIKLGKERDELSVVFDQVGTPTYAADLAKSILEIITHSEKNGAFKNGIFHFSNEGVASWYDFAVEIMKLAKLECRVLPIETKDYPTLAHRPAYSVLNKSKIKQEFNIEIAHWTDALNRCIELLSSDTLVENT